MLVRWYQAPAQWGSPPPDTGLFLSGAPVTPGWSLLSVSGSQPQLWLSWITRRSILISKSLRHWEIWPEPDLRQTLERPERERWRLRDLESTLCRTDRQTKWLLELLTEPKNDKEGETQEHCRHRRDIIVHAGWCTFHPLTQGRGDWEMPHVMEPIRVMCGLRLLITGVELLLCPARCDLWLRQGGPRRGQSYQSPHQPSTGHTALHWSGSHQIWAPSIRMIDKYSNE